MRELVDRIQVASLEAAVGWLSGREMAFSYSEDQDNPRIRWEYEAVLSDDDSHVLVYVATPGSPMEPLEVQYLARYTDSDDDSHYYSTTVSLTLRRDSIRLAMGGNYFEVKNELVPGCLDALSRLRATLLAADRAAVTVRGMDAVTPEAEAVRAH